MCPRSLPAMPSGWRHETVHQINDVQKAYHPHARMSKRMSVRVGKLFKVKVDGEPSDVGESTHNVRIAVPKLRTGAEQVSRSIVVTVEDGKRIAFTIAENSVEGHQDLKSSPWSLVVLAK